MSDLQGVLKDFTVIAALYTHENFYFWSKLALIFIIGKSVYQHKIASKYLKNEKKANLDQKFKFSYKDRK
jgi:hypothetical protein